MAGVKTVQVSNGTSAGTVTSLDGSASAKSADYTVLDSDAIRTILMTAGGTAKTVTLPTVADNPSRIITVVKVDSGVGTVIIDGEGSETIDGATSLTLYSPGESVTLQANGTGTAWFSLKGPYDVTSAKSADYTVTDSDRIGTVLMTTSSTTRTVTLPTATDNIGRRLTIKKVDSGTGAVIVDGEGSETIDGETTVTLFKQYEAITIECDGTTWHIANANWASGTYTPVITNSTNLAASTASVTNYVRVRNMVTVSGKITLDPTSANTETVALFTLPIASNFTATEDLGGALSQAANTAASSGVTYANTASDQVEIVFFPTSASNAIWFFVFMYQIK